MPLFLGLTRASQSVMSTVELSKGREVGSWYVFWGVFVEWGRPLARGVTESSECGPGKGTLIWG